MRRDALLARRLDVEPVHPVVTDLQGCDPARLTLALFHGVEKVTGIGTQCPQRIELLIVAIGDHVSVTRHHRRILLQSAREDARCLGPGCERVRHRQERCRVDCQQRSVNLRQQLQRMHAAGRVRAGSQYRGGCV